MLADFLAIVVAQASLAFWLLLGGDGGGVTLWDAVGGTGGVGCGGRVRWRLVQAA